MSTPKPQRFSTVLIVCLTVGYFAVSGTAKPIRILFIGNSLTYVNDLPGMVTALAKTQGIEAVCDSYTRGGARLAQHAANPEVMQKIKQQTWDFVVLQEQSQYPGFSQKQLARDVFPYAQQLAAAVKKANGRASVVFYMTMARRNGDPDNRAVSPELLTYEGMQKRVNRCYLAMGKMNRALVAPVGEVWLSMRQQESDLELYADNVHPNKTGTYLTACVFYTSLFNKKSNALPPPAGIDPKLARTIQHTVDKTVLQERRKWDLRK